MRVEIKSKTKSKIVVLWIIFGIVVLFVTSGGYNLLWLIILLILSLIPEYEEINQKRMHGDTTVNKER